MERKLINPRKKQKILERDNFTCQKCGIKSDFAALEIDHILPVILGGTNNEKNLQTLCYKCNMEKRWKSDKENIEILKDKTPREKLNMIKFFRI